MIIVNTTDLVISKSNEVFLKINTEPHIEYELRDHFKFEVPNESLCHNIVVEIGTERFTYMI